MKKFWLMVPLVMLLVGCVGIETETTFNNNGSGSMTFTYRLGNILMQMGEGESDVDLPFDKESLEDSLEGADGVTLKEVKTWEDETDTYVSAEIDFESIDNFYEQDEYDDMQAQLTKTATGFKYRQQISSGTGSEPTEEDAAATAMVAPYFEGYMVKIILHTPKKIKTANMGEITNGGKTLTYEIPMMDVTMMVEPTYLEVEW